MGRPIIEGQKARNFFPKTNERQPNVDVNGFGPSFNTRFFDALDLHSGFFDHNFPGSPAADDYELNFNKPNPQFNKVSQCHNVLHHLSAICSASFTKTQDAIKAFMREDLKLIPFNIY